MSELTNRLLSNTWKGIKHFKPEEFHRPDKLSPSALHLLDATRDFIEGRAIITINADYAESGHAPNSWHYRGRAFDLVIRDKETKLPLPIMEQFLIAIRFKWTGIGVYPYWKSPGLHLDNRPLAATDRRAMWFRDKGGYYHPVEELYPRLIPSLTRPGADNA